MPRPRNIAPWVAAGLAIALAFWLLDVTQRGHQDRGPLIVGANLWPGYEPLYLAESEGFFDDSEVRMVDYAAPSQVRDAFRNGVIHAAAVTLDEALLLRSHGFDVCVVLVLDVSAGADGIVARVPIRDVAELAGLRVGVEHSSLGTLMLARALERAGLDVDDITVVDVQEHEHLAAFRDGQVDALVTSDPVRSQALALGGTQIFDSSELPGEIVDVLVVSREVLRERGDQIEELIAGWQRAVSLLHSERHRERALASMARRLGIPPAEIERSLEGIVIPGPEETLAMLSGEPSQVDRALAGLARIMVEGGLLEEAGPPPAFAEPGPLQRVSEKGLSP